MTGLPFPCFVLWFSPTRRKHEAMPERIQRKRTKGWRMPKGAVYVGRPTKWGNPVPVGRVTSKHPDFDAILALLDWPTAPFGISWHSITVAPMQAVDAYFDWIVNQPSLFLSVADLRGRDLACWCPLDHPCHADVLLEIANRVSVVEQPHQKETR